MSALNTKRIVLAARPAGKPQETDFRLEEVPLPDPGPGQLNFQTVSGNDRPRMSA